MILSTDVSQECTSRSDYKARSKSARGTAVQVKDSWWRNRFVWRWKGNPHRANKEEGDCWSSRSGWSWEGEIEAMGHWGRRERWKKFAAKWCKENGMKDKNVRI